MDGGYHKYLTRCLAVIACLAGSSVALGQDSPLSTVPADPTYVANNEAMMGQLAPAPADKDPSDLSARVKDLEAALASIKAKEEADKKKAASAPSVKGFGRIFWDTANFSQNATSILQSGDAYNGTEFRNARIGLQGEAFNIIDYKIEMDFAAQTSFKDVYIQVNDLPYLQSARAGHFYEAFGLEAQTGTNFTTFMEKSLINEIGDIGGYKTGVMVFGSTENKRLFWQFGGNTSLRSDRPPIMPYDSLTSNRDDFNGGAGLYGLYDDRGGYSFDMRTAALLWYDEATEGRGLWEVGASYSYRSLPHLVAGQTRGYRLRDKPESNMATYVVNTGWLDDTDSLNAFGPEMLFVYGPFSVQSEYLCMWLDRTAHADPMFDGGYVYVSYFLTGENRTLSRKGVLRPGRIQPFENFFRVRGEDGCIYTGKGAWEVAYRASYLNLTDAGVAGGRVVDHTLGVNWYLNAYTKLMLNYIHSEATAQPVAGVGVLDAVMTRVQIDF